MKILQDNVKFTCTCYIETQLMTKSFNALGWAVDFYLWSLIIAITDVLFKYLNLLYETTTLCKG